MLRKQLPDSSGDCDTSVLDKNKALAQQLRDRHTDHYFENGKRIPGAPDKASEEMLAAVKNNSALTECPIERPKKQLHHPYATAFYFSERTDSTHYDYYAPCAAIFSLASSKLRTHTLVPNP